MLLGFQVLIYQYLNMCSDLTASSSCQLCLLPAHLASLLPGPGDPPLDLVLLVDLAGSYPRLELSATVCGNALWVLIGSLRP